MGKGRIVRCAFCKHPRTHYAKGMCERCFRREYMRKRYWRMKSEKEARRRALGEDA